MASKQPLAAVIFLCAIFLIGLLFVPVKSCAASLDLVYLGEDAHNKKYPGAGLLPKRFALVIGVNNYRENDLKLNKLTGAARDARKIAKALREQLKFEVEEIIADEKCTDEQTRENKCTCSSLDFEEKKCVNEVSKNTILNAIERLNSKASTEKSTSRPPVLLFYYEGHGVSAAIDGTYNHFIVPSDANPVVADDVPEMSISVSSVINRLASTSPALRIVILNACRDDVSRSLPTRYGRNVSFNAWSIDDKAEKTDQKYELSKTLNGLYLFHATEDTIKARDNGDFAAAIYAKIDEMRRDAEQAKSGKSSLIDEIAHSAYSVLQGSLGNAQKPNVSTGASKFKIFSTKQDYQAEKHSFDSLNNSPYFSPMPRDVELEKWCRAKLFVDEATPYSYFSQEVVAKWDDNAVGDWSDDKFDCNKFRGTLSSTIDKDIAVPQKGDVSASHLTESHGPTLREVLPSSVAAKLGSINLEKSADSLAFAVANTTIQAKSKPHKSEARLQAGQLVQVEQNRDGRISIRTAGGVSGDVDRLELVRGRTPVAYVMAFPADEITADKSLVPAKVKTLFREALVTDASVTYPSIDGTIGLSRAQSVAAALVDAARGESQASFVPRVRPDSEKNLILHRNQIRVAMSLLPLSSEAREALGPLLSADKLEVAHALDISAIRSGKGFRDLSDAKDKDLVPPKQGLSKAASCMEIGRELASEREFGLALPERQKVSVYVQLNSGSSIEDYDVLSAGSRAMDFRVPSYEIMRKSIERNEIRYCPGGHREFAAKSISKLIERCGIGSLEPKRLPKSICLKVNGDNIEVWLARK